MLFSLRQGAVDTCIVIMLQCALPITTAASPLLRKQFHKCPINCQVPHKVIP